MATDDVLVNINGELREGTDAHVSVLGRSFASQYDLYTADECFVTNSLIGIRPVTKIHDRDVGDGTIGPVTQQLGEAFRSHLLASGTQI